jgi:hypothetical protein
MWSHSSSSGAVDQSRVGNCLERHHGLVDGEAACLARLGERRLSAAAVVEPELLEGAGAGGLLEHELGHGTGRIDRHCCSLSVQGLRTKRGVRVDGCGC